MLVAVRTLVHLRYFLKAAVLHYFPSRVLLDAAVLRCCLFPVHCSRFTTSIETRVVVVYSCCLHKISIHYGCSTTSTELAFGSDSRACDVTNPCSLRNFLKAAVLHYFPSRVQLCLLRCVPSLTYGNTQRLDGMHLHSDELFSESRHLALLPFRSSGVLFKVFPAPGGSWFLDFFGQVKGHGKDSFGAQASQVIGEGGTVECYPPNIGEGFGVLSPDLRQDQTFCRYGLLVLLFRAPPGVSGRGHGR